MLGVIDVRRWSTPRWPRFVVDSLHRNVSLLAMVFLVVHILTSVLDSFAPISLLDAVVPFAGSYRPFWLGLGAVAFDLLLAVTITSLLRQRMGFGTWRAIHWLTYASWPIALLHGFGTGSDVKSAWLLLLSVVCLLAGARRGARARAERLARRRATAQRGTRRRRRVLAVPALWLPSGPLGSEWARRSGTPSSLLPHATRQQRREQTMSAPDRRCRDRRGTPQAPARERQRRCRDCSRASAPAAR